MLNTIKNLFKRKRKTIRQKDKELFERLMSDYIISNIKFDYYKIEDNYYMVKAEVFEPKYVFNRQPKNITNIISRIIKTKLNENNIKNDYWVGVCLVGGKYNLTRLKLFYRISNKSIHGCSPRWGIMNDQLKHGDWSYSSEKDAKEAAETLNEIMKK